MAEDPEFVREDANVRTAKTRTTTRTAAELIAQADTLVERSRRLQLDATATSRRLSDLIAASEALVSYMAGNDHIFPRLEINADEL